MKTKNTLSNTKQLALKVLLVLSASVILNPGTSEAGPIYWAKKNAIDATRALIKAKCYLSYDVLKAMEDALRAIKSSITETKDEIARANADISRLEGELALPGANTREITEDLAAQREKLVVQTDILTQLEIDKAVTEALLDSCNGRPQAFPDTGL